MNRRIDVTTAAGRSDPRAHKRSHESCLRTRQVTYPNVMKRIRRLRSFEPWTYSHVGHTSPEAADVDAEMPATFLRKPVHAETFFRAVWRERCRDHL